MNKTVIKRQALFFSISLMSAALLLGGGAVKASAPGSDSGAAAGEPVQEFAEEAPDTVIIYYSNANIEEIEGIHASENVEALPSDSIPENAFKGSASTVLAAERSANAPSEAAVAPAPTGTAPASSETVMAPAPAGEAPEAPAPEAAAPASSEAPAPEAAPPAFSEVPEAPAPDSAAPASSETATAPEGVNAEAAPEEVSLDNVSVEAEALAGEQSADEKGSDEKISDEKASDEKASDKKDSDEKASSGTGDNAATTLRSVEELDAMTGKLSNGTGTAPAPLPELGSALLSQIAIRLPEENGTWAVFIKRMNGEEEQVLNNHPMQSASLIKLFIMGAVYEQYDALAQTYTSSTLDQNLRPMITVSDNDCANNLVTYLGGGDAAKGMKAVNDFCAAHNFTETHMGRLLLHPATEDDNITSVSDVGHFLEEVYKGVFGDGESTLSHTQEMFDFLSAQQVRHKIPSQMPDGASVANKTGELSDVENDAAIINPGQNGEGLIVVFMSEALSNTYQAQNKIAETARFIYDFYAAAPAQNANDTAAAPAQDMDDTAAASAQDSGDTAAAPAQDADDTAAAPAE